MSCGVFCHFSNRMEHTSHSVQSTFEKKAYPQISAQTDSSMFFYTEPHTHIHTHLRLG